MDYRKFEVRERERERESERELEREKKGKVMGGETAHVCYTVPKCRVAACKLVSLMGQSSAWSQDHQNRHSDLNCKIVGG
jgi:hypothetical protein